MTCDRNRGTEPGTEPDEDTDRFWRDTTRMNNAVEHWLERYEKPAPGAKVTKSISFIKFGTRLNRFPGICHGGALFTLMDEVMLRVVVANTFLDKGLGFMKMGKNYWRQQFMEDKPPQEVPKGWLVMASIDVELFAPVLRPGAVGIEAEVLEDKGHKMSMSPVMSDGQGKCLLQAEGLWVKLGKTMTTSIYTKYTATITHASGLDIQALQHQKIRSAVLRCAPVATVSYHTCACVKYPG